MELELGKIFIGGISWDTDEDRLREYFQGFGEVVEAVIMKDRITGRARGFGFIIFADPAVVDRVVMEKHLIDGRMVEAKRAVPRDDLNILGRSTPSIQGSPGPTRTKKIFVGGLASTVTDVDFRNYFEQFGAITDVVVMYDHNTQRPRGFGFITYESEDSVDKVLLKTFHELNGKMVEVKRAVPKDLSPSPNIRSPIGGYNIGMNRINSLFNGYSQGYNPSSINGYGLARFGPLASGRTGFPSFNPGHGIGMNFEPGMGSNFNGGLNYARTLNPYYNNANSNRFNSAIAYGGGNLSPGSVFSSPTRNLWGNGGNLNYSNNNTANSNSYFASGFGNSAPNWGGSSSPIVPHNNNSSFNANSIGYGSGENNNFGLGASNYGRSNVQGSLMNNNVTSNNSGSSFNPLSNGYERNYSDSYGSGSIYGDPTWRSATSDIDGSNPFGYGLGNGDSEVSVKGSAGYVGYNVSSRQTNGGIAA